MLYVKNVIIYILLDMILSSGFRLFFLNMIILPVISQKGTTKFCSAYCDPDKCSDIGETNCTGCRYPFTLNGSTCIVDESTGFI